MTDAFKKIRKVFGGIDWEAHLAKRFAQSWFIADRRERRARMHVIFTLLRELEAIQAVNLFCCGIGQSLVEDIVDGDWQGVERTADHFLFLGEREELRAQLVPLWNTFRVLALGAVAEAKRRAEGNPTVPS